MVAVDSGMRGCVGSNCGLVWDVGCGICWCRCCKCGRCDCDTCGLDSGLAPLRTTSCKLSVDCLESRLKEDLRNFFSFLPTPPDKTPPALPEGRRGRTTGSVSIDD